MNAEIETLAKLQATELDRARLLKEAKALPAQIAEVEKELAAAQKSAAAAEAALKREEELRDKLEREAGQHRQKAVRYRAQLDTVTTTAQAAAIEHEVHFADSEVERLEGEEFASLERTEAQEAALAKARTETGEWTVALDKTRVRVAQQQAEIAAAVAALDAEGATLRQAADVELLARYDRIAASRGTGLALAENVQCTGCRMGIRLQVWSELREGQVRTCDSCGRLLYWNPAIATEPKAPQAETPSANGDGRAIRKPKPAGA
ncbi:MAG: C4-type zinc ribbon domain-containing protein [Terracidiphilus sp.]|nr:C4-type zinc ribbon domain-containing protein [Terracidiphilus sp.]